MPAERDRFHLQVSTVSYHFCIYDLTLALVSAALLVGRAQRYLLLPLVVAPVALLHIGQNWFFLLALPSVALLAYASASTRNRAAASPDIIAATPV
jgi:hypothetical protein